jgi:hypothetical protein
MNIFGPSTLPEPAAPPETDETMLALANVIAAELQKNP